MSDIRSPQDCESKQDVRAEIDRIDGQLMVLFGERHGYVQRVADFKTDASQAFDPERIEAVIEKVRGRAVDAEADPDQAEVLWRTLIDWNINFEKGIIAARNES